MLEVRNPNPESRNQAYDVDLFTYEHDDFLVLVAAGNSGDVRALFSTGG